MDVSYFLAHLSGRTQRSDKQWWINIVLGIIDWGKPPQLSGGWERVSVWALVASLLTEKENSSVYFSFDFSQESSWNMLANQYKSNMTVGKSCEWISRRTLWCGPESWPTQEIHKRRNTHISVKVVMIPGTRWLTVKKTKLKLIQRTSPQTESFFGTNG